MKLQTLLTVIIMGITLLLSGCSRTIQAKNSGFFKNYEHLADSKFAGNDLSKYKNIIVAPVLVIPAISEDKQTLFQKKLYKEISEYLTSEYKKKIKNSTKFGLTEKKSLNTLILQSAVSTVEVHFDDKKWDQYSPISMGLSVVSFNAYADEDVRILGEKRLVNAETGDTINRSRNILKDVKIIINGDKLEFKDMKPALDSWIKKEIENLNR